MARSGQLSMPSGQLKNSVTVGPFLIVAMTGGRVTSAAVAAAGAADTRFTLDFRAADGTWQRGPLVSCLGARFEDVPPVREFRFQKGLRNFAGWWYFATTGTHIGFESWLERDHLMLMDFDPAVRAVSSQPDRKSTRLNSSHGYISYAVFCLKKKKNT